MANDSLTSGFGTRIERPPMHETGYFQPSQYNHMSEWIQERREYLLVVQGWGQTRDDDLPIYFKGRVIHQPTYPKPKAILVLLWQFKVEKDKTDIPLILRIPKENFVNKRFKGKKLSFHLDQLEINNSFVKEDNSAIGYDTHQFEEALGYQDRFLPDYHLRIIALGKFHQFDKTYSALLEGFIKSDKRTGDIILCMDTRIWNNQLDTFKKEQLLYTQEIVPCILPIKRKRKEKVSTPSNYPQYFEATTLIFILDSIREAKHNIVEIKNLTVSFGKRTIIKDANMNIRHGTIVGIIGESGAGKSTTVKAMLAQIPYSGDIKILGIDAHQTKRIANNIGYVPQDLSMVYHNFNALENMIHFGRQYNIEEEEITRRSKQILKDLDIAPYMDKSVGSLSGGQKRRVSVAMALVHNPKIVILDEPTSGLDPMTRFSLWRFLDRVNKLYGITLIVISHYLDEIEYSDKSAIYLKGIGFFDYASPAELKKKLPGKGKAIEISLSEIDLRAPKILEKIEGVEAIIQRGGRIRILSQLNLSMLSTVIKETLLAENIKLYRIQSDINIDIMDYFTYYSKTLGSGQVFENKEDSV